MAYDKSKSTNSIFRDLIIGTSDTEPVLRTSNIDSSSLSINPSTYSINDWKETGSVTYTLNLNSEGKWLFIKYDESGKSARYANESNNPTMTTYALASDDYSTLTYDLLEVLN